MGRGCCAAYLLSRSEHAVLAASTPHHPMQTATAWQPFFVARAAEHNMMPLIAMLSTHPSRVVTLLSSANWRGVAGSPLWPPLPSTMEPSGCAVGRAMCRSWLRLSLLMAV